MKKSKKNKKQKSKMPPEMKQKLLDAGFEQGDGYLVRHNVPPQLVITKAWRPAHKTSTRIYFMIGDNEQRLFVEANTMFGRALIARFGL